MDKEKKVSAVVENLTLERAKNLSKGLAHFESLGSEENNILELTLSEALIIGLLRQGVRRYFAIFGHAPILLVIIFLQILEF